MRLTDITVRSLKAPPQGSKVYHCDTIPGFGCRVTAAGVKSFVWTFGPQRERATIGRYPVISLQDARAEVLRRKAELTLGKHRPKRQSFGEALETFLTTHVAEKNKPSTASETTRILRKHFKALHGKQLADLQTDDVTKLTDKLLAKGHPSAANHAFTAVRTFLKWCVRRRLIQHSPVEALELPAKAIARERVLTDEELLAVWRAAEARPGQFGTIVKLLMLTGQRRSEISSLHAHWCSLGSSDAEKQGEQSTIALPASVTKNKRKHTFPIGTLSAGVIGKVPEGTTLLFPARGSKKGRPFSGWSKAKAQLDSKVSELVGGPMEPWTLHDLRRTYVTILQRLKVPFEVREALVNHVSGETRAGVAGVYNRYSYWNEMVEAVQAYERWFEATILTDQSNPS